MPRKSKHKDVVLVFSRARKQQRRTFMAERQKRAERAALYNDLSWVAFIITLVVLYGLFATQ